MLSKIVRADDIKNEGEKIRKEWSPQSVREARERRDEIMIV